MAAILRAPEGSGHSQDHQLFPTHLIGIMDNPAAGFDGYQEEAAGVDQQVQAIWTALVNEYRIQYINPPPPIPGKPSGCARRATFWNRIAEPVSISVCARLLL